MNHSSPTVSVVLPTHNRASTLGPAIESVLSQSFADLELIVVDDGSTDDTLQLLRSLADERLRILELPTRSGASAARNLGIDAARGRYVAFQDSDDLWRAGKLAGQVSTLDLVDSEVAVVYGAILRHRPDGTVRIPHVGYGSVRGNLANALTRENFIPLPSAMVRTRQLRDAGGFDIRLPRFQDWDLWLTLAHKHRFEYLDEVVVDSQETAGSITLDQEAYYSALATILVKHRDHFGRSPRSATMFHLQLAHHALSNKCPRQFWKELRSIALVAGIQQPASILRTIVHRSANRNKAVHGRH